MMPSCSGAKLHQSLRQNNIAMTAGIIKGGVAGYWGPQTSSLDWCETNYTIMYHIAEFWNTASNAFYLLLAIHGLSRWWKHQIEWRFLFVYASLISIGCGSILFHATLKYETQLMDELPMLFGSATMFYCVIETKARVQHGVKVPMLLWAFCCLCSLLYIQFKDPAIFLVSFAIMVAGISLGAQLVSKASAGKERQLVHQGLAYFLLGFLIWNIDNVFCDSLRQVQKAIIENVSRLPLPFSINVLAAEALASPFQLHAWWHLFSGYGGYLTIVYLEYQRLELGQFNRAMPPKKRQSVICSRIVKHENGQQFQVGISFWRGFLPYTWIQHELTASPKRRQMSADGIILLETKQQQ